MPSKKPSTALAQPNDANPTLTTRIIDKVMAKLDLDQLAASLADKLGEKLLATVNTDTLADTLLDRYQEEFEHTLTEAILAASPPKAQKSMLWRRYAR